MMENVTRPDHLNQVMLIFMVRNVRGSQRWKAGYVMQRLGPLSYMVKVQDQLRHVHIDHLLSGSVHGNNETEEAHDDIDNHVPVNPPPVPQEVPAMPLFPNVQNVVPPLRRNPPRHFGAPVKARSLNRELVCKVTENCSASCV